jgi:4,5-dihydroxyphthalate decarboxylase
LGRGALKKLRLSFAVSDYDHVRDLSSGKISVEGVEPLWLDLPIEEIFHRLLTYGEFDVSEVSMGMYTSLISQGNDDYLAIPVFPIRTFRHSSVFIRTDGAIERPEDLIGKRVGIAQWTQTALTYVRAFLMHDYGINLNAIHWLQGGVNQAGRTEPVSFALPPGVELTQVKERSLNEMLLDGDLDAMISAREPLGFSDGDPRVRRLFKNFQAEEKAYFRRTGVFPIMHAVVIRKTLLDAHPWLARNVYDAFEAARRAGVERTHDNTSSRFALPWTYAYAMDAAGVLGEDPFAYGITPNAVTLDAFVRYAYEQGVAQRLVDVGELFARQLTSEYRV